MDAHSQIIFNEFVENKEIYDKVKDIALEIINGIIRDNGLYVVAVEARTKTAKSLEGKLDLKGYKYSSLSDITDIVGTRVVTFYEYEVDKIAALVEKHFVVDWNESVDKRKLYSDENADRFGYMSLHYIISIPKSYYYDEACPKINEVRFELQMRTALQHIWATSAHDTGYKSDLEIPKAYIRKLSRLAGLLELADKEFSDLITGIDDYRRKVYQLVSNGKFENLSLDGDTFKAALEAGLLETLNKRIANINRAEITSGNMMPYLEVFKFLEFSTLNDVVQLLNNYSEYAYQLALAQLAETDIDILSSSIGLKNLCLCYMYDNDMGLNGFKRFYDIINGERAVNSKLAEKTMSTLGRIKLL